MIRVVVGGLLLAVHDFLNVFLQFEQQIADRTQRSLLRILGSFNGKNFFTDAVDLVGVGR